MDWDGPREFTQPGAFRRVLHGRNAKDYCPECYAQIAPRVSPPPVAPEKLIVVHCSICGAEHELSALALKARGLHATVPPTSTCADLGKDRFSCLSLQLKRIEVQVERLREALRDGCGCRFRG